MLDKHFSNELKVATSHVEESRFSEQLAKKQTWPRWLNGSDDMKKLSAGALRLSGVAVLAADALQ